MPKVVRAAAGQDFDRFFAPQGRPGRLCWVAALRGGAVAVPDWATEVTLLEPSATEVVAPEVERLVPAPVEMMMNSWQPPVLLVN